MPSSEKSSALKRAQALIAESRSLCILTGAGISAESGLGTFRNAGGLWENHSLEQVATPEGFEANPELVWKFYNARRKAADVAAPNPAHLALARLETGFKRQRRMRRKGLEPEPVKTLSSRQHLVGSLTLLTQNIDGLHQQAGSQNVVELHGSVWRVRCTECHAVTTEHPIELPLLPFCETCHGLLRPDIVWFGEGLDPDVLDTAEAAVRACDVFLVVGTSAVVQPAAMFPFRAARRGIPVIEINLEDTALSDVATVSLRGKAGELLPLLTL